MSSAGLSPFHRAQGRALHGRTILQIIPRLETGGAERTTIDIAAALVQAGARALVAAEGGRLASELQAVGGVLVPFPAATKNPIKMALNTRRLAQIMQAERVDILHARSRAPAWVALGACRMAKLPLVTTFHGAYGGGSMLKLRYNSVMARGDIVIANSQFTADMIARLYPQAQARIRLVHRGVNLLQFSPAMVEPSRVARLRAEWGVEPDEPIVLLAARLTSWKGQKVLVEAARLLKAQGVEGVRYILAGDAQGRSAYVGELDAFIEKSGLAGIVKRVGHCADMPAALKAASIAVQASTEPEAFGRAAVEAQAMGALTIVSDLGAVPETVLAPPDAPAEARTGWRVPPGDPAALAQALGGALQLGATAREVIARRARAHVEANFSLDAMANKTLDIYRQLLK